MKRKVIEFSSFVLISLTLILLFVSSIRIIYGDFNLKEYSNHLILIGIIGLIIYVLSKIKNFKFSRYEVIIIVMAVLACLSLVNAINMDAALWGRINRNEGLFVILTYYVLMLIGINIKNKMYLNILISLMIFIGLGNLFYGFMQKGFLEIPFVTIINSDFRYASGFNGNHMSFGSLMSLFLPLVLGIYLKSTGLVKNIICYILVFAFLVGVVISGTMSIFVGLLVVGLIILIELIIKLMKRDFNSVKRQTLRILLLIVPCVLAIFVGMRYNNSLKSDIVNTYNEAVNLLQGNIDDGFGTGRIHIWKNTIEKIKDNYLTGVGIDNFYYAFKPPLIDISSGLYVAKAHNDYLQKMLCEGVVSGFVFIGFLLYIFICNFNMNKNSKYYGLMLAFVCYSVQAFFGISVTRVAPIYFIIIGLLISNCVKEKSID